MQSFRTELENPLVEKDIVDLARKIELFREGWFGLNCLMGK
jgi:sulfite reductase (ferredoxin)